VAVGSGESKKKTKRFLKIEQDATLEAFCEVGLLGTIDGWGGARLYHYVGRKPAGSRPGILFIRY
jgi:hypothetical protein